jgi:limonene-1,2-epoxide hydrolase
MDPHVLAACGGNSADNGWSGTCRTTIGEALMNSSPEAVVRAFFEEMGSGTGLLSSLENHCSPECRWENSGLPTANGRAEMAEMMKGFINGWGLAAIVVDLVNIIASGETVLTERIDHLNGKDGTLLSLPLAGVLVVRNGKIVRWSDYFDPRPFIPA